MLIIVVISCACVGLRSREVTGSNPGPVAIGAVRRLRQSCGWSRRHVSHTLSLSLCVLNPVQHPASTTASRVPPVASVRAQPADDRARFSPLAAISGRRSSGVSPVLTVNKSHRLPVANHADVHGRLVQRDAHTVQASTSGINR